MEKEKHICPVEYAGVLDNNIRRLIQNPRKILKPYIKEGITILDFGCGPGFFSIQTAKMLSGTGKVIAADIQEGMLNKINGIAKIIKAKVIKMIILSSKIKFLINGIFKEKLLNLNKNFLSLSCCFFI